MGLQSLNPQVWIATFLFFTTQILHRATNANCKKTWCFHIGSTSLWQCNIKDNKVFSNCLWYRCEDVVAVEIFQMFQSVSKYVWEYKKLHFWAYFPCNLKPCSSPPYSFFLHPLSIIQLKIKTCFATC